MTTLPKYHPAIPSASLDNNAPMKDPQGKDLLRPDKYEKNPFAEDEKEDSWYYPAWMQWYMSKILGQQPTGVPFPSKENVNFAHSMHYLLNKDNGGKTWWGGDAEWADTEYGNKLGRAMQMTPNLPWSQYPELDEEDIPAFQKWMLSKGQR